VDPNRQQRLSTAKFDGTDTLETSTLNFRFANKSNILSHSGGDGIHLARHISLGDIVRTGLSLFYAFHISL
jgi:hypothetical protein